MPLSHKYKFIFIHITKTGGSSIEKGFSIDIGSNNENRELLYGKIQSPILLNKKLDAIFLQHLSILEIQKLLDPAVFMSYFKFSFVRNPWDRILSEYFFAKNVFSQYDVPFEQFLDNLSILHQLDQCHFITDENGKIIMDFIGRYENLEHDFHRLCQLLKIKKMKLPFINPTIHLHYSHYYNVRTKKIVADLFKRDIETFKYRFEEKNWFFITKHQSKRLLKHLRNLKNHINIYNLFKRSLKNIN